MNSAPRHRLSHTACICGIPNEDERRSVKGVGEVCKYCWKAISDIRIFNTLPRKHKEYFIDYLLNFCKAKFRGTSPNSNEPLYMNAFVSVLCLRVTEPKKQKKKPLRRDIDEIFIFNSDPPKDKRILFLIAKYCNKQTIKGAMQTFMKEGLIPDMAMERADGEVEDDDSVLGRNYDGSLDWMQRFPDVDPEASIIRQEIRRALDGAPVILRRELARRRVTDEKKRDAEAVLSAIVESEELLAEVSAAVRTELSASNPSGTAGARSVRMPVLEIAEHMEATRHQRPWDRKPWITEEKKIVNTPANMKIERSYRVSRRVEYVMRLFFLVFQNWKTEHEFDMEGVMAKLSNISRQGLET